MPRSTFERRAHAGQRQAELDQRDRDGRPHADDDRLGVEHPRHRGDVAEHPADERVDHLERGDVDQHAAWRRVVDDLRGQIVLQRHRQPIVHVHLDGDQQELAHLEDRDAFHDQSSPVRRAPSSLHVRRRGLPDSAPRGRALSATANASASVAFVDHVAEIDAQMDDRLRDLRPDAADDAVGAHQPRRRDGLQQMLRHRACRPSGTPVMSMIAISAPVSTMRCSRFSMTTCVRALSSVPISGSARMPSHSSRPASTAPASPAAGGRSPPRGALKYLGRVEPEPVEQDAVGVPSALSELGCQPTIACSRSKSGCLSEKTNVAVSDGEKPCWARAADSSSSTWRAVPRGEWMSGPPRRARPQQREEAARVFSQLLTAQAIRTETRRPWSDPQATA